MNKKGIIVRAIAVVFIVALFISQSVYADGISTEFPSSNTSIEEIDTAMQKVWGTILTIMQMVAFAAIMFAGIRYMFASADQKADIKKGLGILTIGAILVFATSTIVKFVVAAADDII